MRYNPPYNLTPKQGNIFNLYSKEFRLIWNLVCKQDRKRLCRVMRWIAPHILSFYERDFAPIDPDTCTLLKTEPERADDFRITFGRILSDGTHTFGGFKERQFNLIAEYAASGIAWKACCDRICEIVDMRGQIDDRTSSANHP